MKKLISVMFLVAVFALCGSVSAFAAGVPLIDGAVGAAEWSNVSFNTTPYPYYFDISDSDEADNQVQSMDISRVVLLQEISSVSGDGDNSNDGIYLLIQVYDPTGPALGLIPTPNPYPGLVPRTNSMVEMSGDFLGDGLADGFNIFVRTYNTMGSNSTLTDNTQVCLGSQLSCQVLGGPWTNLTGVNGLGGSFARGADGLEYFFPHSIIGNYIPAGTPFPGSFEGTVSYDNGATGVGSADDVAVGTLVPEPTSMVLMFTGLLGLLAKRKFLA